MEKIFDARIAALCQEAHNSMSQKENHMVGATEDLQEKPPSILLRGGGSSTMFDKQALAAILRRAEKI
jgi:hypothetical protein